MTDEIAIEYIEFDKKCLQEDCDWHCRDCIKGNDEVGIMESYDMAISALKKQIPMKVSFQYELVNDGIDEESSNREAVWRCPVCNEIIDVTVNYHSHYCSYCGQALDWGED